MAITFFNTESTSTAGNLPFLNEWIEENTKNKQQNFTIEEVVNVKSGKGYLVKTTDFSTFLWKNSKDAKHLIEALDHYVNKQEYGHPLFVHLPNPKKKDFILGCDTEVKLSWFAVKNGYSTTEDTTTENTTVTGNPFLK